MAKIGKFTKLPSVATFRLFKSCHKWLQNITPVSYDYRPWNVLSCCRIRIQQMLAAVWFTQNEDFVSYVHTCMYVNMLVSSLTDAVHVQNT